MTDDSDRTYTRPVTDRPLLPPHPISFVTTRLNVTRRRMKNRCDEGTRGVSEYRPSVPKTGPARRFRGKNRDLGIGRNAVATRSPGAFTNTTAVYTGIRADTAGAAFGVRRYVKTDVTVPTRKIDFDDILCPSRADVSRHYR